LLSKILHKYNIAVSYRKKNKFKKNTFNENFFIEKNEKLSYFMGFILADGCLKQNKEKYTYSMKVSVSEKDKYILDMFCDWTNFNKNYISIETKKIVQQNNKIYYCKNMYNLIYFSKEIFSKDFSEWGIVPNKTYIGAIPYFNENNKELLVPFLLGLIDGDGGLSFNNKSRMFQLTCNKNIILWFKKMLEELGYTGSYKIDMPENKCWGRFKILRKADLLSFGKILNITKYSYIMDRKWNDLKLAINSETI
jgi:hypothetical protein